MHFVYSLIEIEAVNGSGPVDLWFNERLRKEKKMGSGENMFDGAYNEVIITRNIDNAIEGNKKIPCDSV